MASVQLNRAVKYARRGMLEDEPPDCLETAGNLMIKQLVQKQTKTDFTLEQQMQNEKKFEQGVGFIPLSDLTAGTLSLDEFEKKRKEAEKVEELKRRGFMGMEALSMVSRERQSKAEPNAQATKQKLLNDDLQRFQLPVLQNDYEPGKRQEWELALSEKPDSLETRLYHFAMRNEANRVKADSRPPEHPINRLAEMEQNLLQSANPQRLAQTYCRKRRQQLEAQAKPPTVHYKAPKEKGTLWDEIEEPVNNNKDSGVIPKRIASCNKQTLYTVKEGKIVCLSEKFKEESTKIGREVQYNPGGQAFVALQAPCEKPKLLDRLSEEEIRLQPKFINYERGIVSKTLFIKNLSRNVTEMDLSALFGHFQEANENKIIYRLMNGKMKGQAFVTFPSLDKATAALDAVNGTVLNGKPIVIQYGKLQH